MSLILRVVAAYEKAVLGEDGQIHTEIFHRYLSNELRVICPAWSAPEVEEPSEEPELPENQPELPENEPQPSMPEASEAVQ